MPRTKKRAAAAETREFSASFADGYMTLKIPFTSPKDAEPSKSGLSKILASTHGNMDLQLPDGMGMAKLGVNCYKSIPK